MSRGLLNAALVVTPLAVGYLLGLLEATVLVAIGALNVLLVEWPFPAPTSGKVLVVATGSNAMAFAVGTAVGLLPRWFEIPLIALCLFVALWGTRFADWENVSFFAGVMFVFAVGVPPTTTIGVLLRPAAVLLGGAWAISALAFLSVLRSRQSPDFFAPLPGRTPHPTGTPATVHSAVLAATATVGLVIGLSLGLPRDYWIMLTVLVALRLDVALTLSYTAARIVGTVAGAAIAFVLTSLTSDPWVLLPILLATTFASFASRSVNYVVYSIGITLTVIVLLNLVYSGGPALAVARVIDTVIGGSLALVVAVVLASLVHRSERSAARAA